MKKILVNTIKSYIEKEEKNLNFLNDVSDLLLKFNGDILEVLNEKNKQLLETTFEKIIPDFINMRSYINSKEIYKSYQQFGIIDFNYNFVKQVKQFLLYLNFVLSKKSKEIIVNDVSREKELYRQIVNDEDNIDYELIYEIIKKSNISLDEQKKIDDYLNDRKNRTNRNALLEEVLNRDELEEILPSTINLAKNLFVSVIDKIDSLEDKFKKLDELILNGIYGNCTNKTNTIEIFKTVITEEILEEQELLPIINENEKLELSNNIDIMFKLIEYLNSYETVLENKEVVIDDFFDYENHPNKIVYVNNSILKDIASIDDQKTLQGIYNLLINIKKNNIPIKSHWQKDIMNSRKIIKIRPNSNNSQARIICELLGNNIYAIVLINAKKDSATSKAVITTAIERLKLYDPYDIVSNINEEMNLAYDREVYNLINRKIGNKKVAKL